MIGDKVFGLLVSHLAGLPVPQTTVLNRRVAPFTFGRPTGSSEVWLRTSPYEQVPGKFTTRKGWIDPFELLRQEDPQGNELASVLSQAAVPSRYAGAAIMTADDKIVIEGKAGDGDTFMQGTSLPEDLPSDVRNSVLELYQRASSFLGAVRFEWVFDGEVSWIVQLHRGATQTTADVLVPGEAEHWVAFDVKEGLENLRKAISQLEPGAGLVLRGEVGLTSHVADVIRRAGVPARIASTRES